MSEQLHPSCDSEGDYLLFSFGRKTLPDLAAEITEQSRASLPPHCSSITNHTKPRASTGTGAHGLQGREKQHPAQGRAEGKEGSLQEVTPGGWPTPGRVFQDQGTWAGSLPVAQPHHSHPTRLGVSRLGHLVCFPRSLRPFTPVHTRNAWRDRDASPLTAANSETGFQMSERHKIHV